MANVHVGPGIYDYAKKRVTVVSLPSFLNTHLRRKIIDFLSINNEGAEYDLMKYFQTVGKGLFSNCAIILDGLL